MSLIERKCQKCGKTFKAKSSDIDRGLAKCCSKSCAAYMRELHSKRGNSKDAGLETMEGGGWDSHKVWGQSL